MNLEEFKSSMLQNTLLIWKHDPQSLGTQGSWSKFRTVLVPELADNLEQFIQDGDYILNYYTDSQNKDYYEIEPLDSNYSIPASGVPACSPYPTTPCDRLAVVSGYYDGWHIFGDYSQRIQRRICENDLTLITRVC
jgi:hypothetical protein